MKALYSLLIIYGIIKLWRRTGYNAIVIVLTGGLISILFNDINMFKGSLFIIGLLLDYLYLIKALSATKQINLLIKRIN